MRTLKAIITIALTATAIFIMARAAEASNAPVEVKGVLPQITNIYDSIVLHGQITEQGRYELFSSGAGRVTKSYVKVGQRVETGQALLELEPPTAQTDTRAAIYSDIESAVSGIVEDSLSGVEDDYRQQGRDLAAAVASAAADVNPAKSEAYVIVSPISGIVMDIIPAGSMVSGILPCVVVSDMGRLAVTAQAGEEVVGAIGEGMECAVSIDALGVADVPGRVELIMPYARQTGGLTQTQQIKTQVVIALPEDMQSLRPGYSATVKIAVNMARDALLVPFEAIGQDEQNREYAMILQNGRVVKKYIKTGREMESGAEILEGVESGDVVLLSPENFTHGQRAVLK